MHVTNGMWSVVDGTLVVHRNEPLLARNGAGRYRYYTRNYAASARKWKETCIDCNGSVPLIIDECIRRDFW